jgi:hypothetical protein
MGMFKKIKDALDSVHQLLVSVVNFILIIPIYFLGAGICRLFYREQRNSRKKSEAKMTYWNKSDPHPRKNEFRRMF